MPPVPRPSWQSAYDAQMELWRWYRTVPGEEFLGAYYQTNAEAFEHKSTDNLLRQMVMSELGRLTDCDPIFVSDEMCEVVNAAKDSFEPEPLLETDLVTPRGFLFFETPFEILDRFDRPTTIAAASWVMQFSFEQDMTPEQLAAVNEMRFSPSSPTTLDDIDAALRAWGGKVSGIALTLYQRDDGVFHDYIRGPVPSLLPMHLTPWYFGMTFDGNEVDTDGAPTGAGWWWQILQTTFRLMQQQIAVRRRELPPRLARHEAKRIGFADRDVVVVRLRRERGEHREPQGEANYSHRFIVSGHWRNQWYPSISMHRQIWISPYVKGPDELPLVVRPRRVFQWER